MRFGSFLFTIACLLGAATAAAQEDPAALAEAARCGMCHHAENPMLGPPWQAIADRYRGEAGAAERLAQHVREGSQGSWGEAMMPPTTREQLGDAELARVIDWILSR